MKALRATEGPSATLASLLKVAPSGRALRERSEQDVAAAVLAALALPGTSFAVFDIDAFARRGGAIDRLRAAGVEVTEPPE